MQTFSEINKSVADLLSEHPDWIDDFEKLGIDYCCHGSQSLAYACQHKGLSAEFLLEQLHTKPTSVSSESIDPAKLSTEELITHIVEFHHRYLRERLPIIDMQLDKVIEHHGMGHPDLHEMKSVFHALREELETHMLKEERVLFPWAKQLASGLDAEMAHHCMHVSMPIQQMEREHDSAGRMLERLKELSGGFTPPTDACATYQQMYKGMMDLTRDLHAHIHKENNILFPNVLTLAKASVR
jgi:regulator of cell morphogenesis and NO signaling